MDLGEVGRGATLVVGSAIVAVVALRLRANKNGRRDRMVDASIDLPLPMFRFGREKPGEPELPLHTDRKALEILIRQGMLMTVLMAGCGVIGGLWIIIAEVLRGG